MLRSALFWLHLTAGCVAGLVVLVMSVTGAALAFQPQMLDGLRRELGALKAPEGAERLSLAALVQRVQTDAPGRTPTGLTLSAEPDAAVMVRMGKSDVLFVHPWTGAVLPDPAAGWARAFQKLTSWHRRLGAEGEGQKIGRAITGAGNAAFLFLALSGLFLWMPGKWKWKSVRKVLWFRRRLKGKARDWNWHHVVGFWTLPVLLVLTASGLMISYPWAQNLIYTLSGEAPQPPGRLAPPKVFVPAPPEGTQPQPLDALVARAVREAPHFEELTVQLAPAGEAVHFTLRLADAFPRFATRSLALDPYSAEVLHRSSHEDQSRGRRIRTWLRYLHTGEALGWPGQLAAGVASLGAVVLVWTGLALALRRLVSFRRRARQRSGALDGREAKPAEALVSLPPR